MNKFLTTILAFVIFAITSCSNDDDLGGRKVTDYKEYTLTVASKKLQGVVVSCGNPCRADVYAVKDEA